MLKHSGGWSNGVDKRFSIAFFMTWSLHHNAFDIQITSLGLLSTIGGSPESEVCPKA